MEITDIAETHVHADFISGSKELKQQLNGKPLIHCSMMGGKEWTPAYADKHISNGDEIILGNIRLKAMHTPGHTPEHLIWLCFDDSRSTEVPCLAFTGDLLFVGSVGRPDLLGQSEMEKLSKELYHSLFTKLSKLRDYLEIYPAHGAGSLCGKELSSKSISTLGYEKQFNQSMIEAPMNQWITDLKHEMPAAPINFQRIKKINVEGPALINDVNESPEKPAMLIDARSPEQFAKGHIKGSVNIPYGTSFCNWVGSVINEDMPLGIVAEKSRQIPAIVKELTLIGFDRIVLKKTWEQLRSDTSEIDTLPLITVERLSEKLKDPSEKVYVLDVRTPKEWNAGHISDAHHLELGLLTRQAHDLPKDVPIITICSSGYRSSLAASFLEKQGFKKVCSVKGGMSAWNKSRLPSMTN